jgi:hypothetical protein
MDFNTIYIRKKPDWITFVSNVQELNNLIDVLPPNKRIVIGDVSVFSAPLRNRLLKIVEENHFVDIYSSKDLNDTVLLSRFVHIEKEHVVIQKNGIEMDSYEQGNKDFANVLSNLSSLPHSVMLRCVRLPYKLITAIVNNYDRSNKY